ncbi:hypothetical protein BwSF12_76810 [Bradyrhizobium ottawaense]|nr:hypothetical protein BwSF12_76810 [Bradyrhizobium ottawaense]GMO94527.1 hypothetical protein BwSF19_74770 [Bradyrhizobium ottawaense]
MFPNVSPVEISGLKTGCNQKLCKHTLVMQAADDDGHRVVIWFPSDDHAKALEAIAKELLS